MKKDFTQLADFHFPDSTLIEAQVIVDCLSENANIPIVRRSIDPSMFSDSDLRETFEKVCELYDQKKDVDLYTLAPTQNARKKLTPCLSDTTVSDNAESHADSLRTMAIRQRLYYASLSVLDDVCNKSLSYDDYTSILDNTKDKVFQGLTISTSLVPLQDCINSLAQQLEDAQTGRTHMIPTSFPILDMATFGGFGPGNLVVLAARPSVGKTAVSLQMARNAASSGYAVAYFSREMTKEEITQRHLLSTDMIKQSDIAGVFMGESKPDFWDKYESAVKKIESIPIYTDELSSSLNAISSQIAQAVHEGKCELAIIDYLGRIDTDSKENIYTRVSRITGKLKDIAKANNIPIVLLCQLNRDVVNENRPPRLSDLRDSGNIEQDADIVLMLENKDDDGLTMWVRKNRQGRKDFPINLRHNDSYTVFLEE